MNTDNMHIVPLAFYDNEDCQYREGVVKRIYGCMWKNDKFKTSHYNIRNKIVMELEVSCYNKALKYANDNNISIIWENMSFISFYARETNRVISHLDMACLECDIPDKIIDGEIIPIEIANLTSTDLIPEKNAEIRENIKRRNEQKIDGKISTMYKCPKCDKRECIIREVQIRSLDEGANINAICKNCSFQWTAA